MFRLKEFLIDNIVIESNYDKIIVKMVDLMANYGISLHKDIY